MTNICIENFSRFGTEYTLKIINELKFKYEISKIDGSYIIIIDKYNYKSYYLINHFLIV